MGKTYIRELQAQLALVKEKLSVIHVPSGPLAKPLPPEIMARRAALLKRKHDIEEKIINHEG